MALKISENIQCALLAAAMLSSCYAVWNLNAPSFKEARRQAVEVRQSRESLVNQVYHITAGEDRILSSKEKGILLKELNIQGTLDETERLTFTPRHGSVEVYAEASYRQWRSLGSVTLTNLSDYIARHETNKLEERQ